ncbi:MAG: choice-of-anchor Q domain-containing protein [Verrucomicrobiota bacterium]
MKASHTTIGAISLIFLTLKLHAAPTHYVDANGTNPVPPYTDWSTAATNIQDAIDAATEGDLVLVTNGVYQTGGRVVYGSMTNRVTLTNAITLLSANGPNLTAIVGGTQTRCVYVGNNSTLIGFTLTNGHTRTTIGDSTNERSGGAVWCESTSATLSNCVLVANFAWASGGAAYQGTLNNCLITSNQASFGYGGGAYLANLNNCIVVGNKSVQSNGGGAAYGTVTSCIFSNNSASNGGGAYSNVLNNCILRNNFAGSLGGGAYGSTLVNCSVVSNTAFGSGGGIYYHGALTNCILYYNTSIKYPNFSTDFAAVMNSCDTFPLAAGAGNITNEPAFVDLPNGDMHLSSTSPCINAGNNACVSSTNDLDGNPRIVGGTVDMGAYEYQTPSSILSYAWAQQYGLPTDGSAENADPDGDGVNNYAEWKSGTNPTNSLSLLQLAAPAFTNSPDGIVVAWQSVASVTYYLQRSSDLAGAFSSIQSNLVGQAGSTSYTDTSATNGGPYFYRVGVH